MKSLPYGRQTITDEDIQEVVSVLKSDFLTQGPKIAEFEQELARFLGVKHAVAVSNGTTALHLAACVVGVQPGDRVLVTPNTFVASANCIRYCGGEVEFVDIDSKTYCLDLNLLEKKLQENPGRYKGVVAVDFAGAPIDFEKLRQIADRHGLWIIQDSCHALGAEFLNSKGEWVKSGSRYADVSIFSFHPVKHVAMGEGGAVTTNSDEKNERLRLLRTHGITKDPKQIAHPDQGWYYEMQELGFNYRLPDLNAALGLSQLRKIESNLKRRREIAKMYDEVFASKGWANPPHPKFQRHAYHLYVLQVEKRQELHKFLAAEKIFAQVHYIPVHQQPYYRNRYGQQALPVCDSYYEKTLSLPMYPALTDEDVKRVIEAVVKFHES